MERYILFFSLFCCIEATSLKCITCHLHLTADRCRRGFGVCVAEKQEKCMTLKIYDRFMTLQLSYLVCQKFCRNLTVELNNRVYVHKCCESNYCNFKDL